MAQLAAWLVASPPLAIVALVLTMLIKVLPMASAAIIVLLVLRQPAQLVIPQVVAAALILIGVSSFLGDVPILESVTALVSVWLPAAVLARILMATRSVTLSMQLSVVAAIVVGGLVVAAVGDWLAVWQPQIDQLLADAREVGAKPVIDLIEGNEQWFADWLTAATLIGGWITAVTGLMLGYWMARKVGGESWGLISDVDFGKVVAALLLVVAVAGMLMNVFWLQAIGAFLLVVFFVQGLIILHWLPANGMATAMAMAVIYVVMLFTVMLGLPQYLFAALAVAGYSEAWLRYRRRVINKAE